MSDLFGNHIVGFPTRRLNNQHIPMITDDRTSVSFRRTRTVCNAVLHQERTTHRFTTGLLSALTSLDVVKTFVSAGFQLDWVNKGRGADSNPGDTNAGVSKADANALNYK